MALVVVPKAGHRLSFCPDGPDGASLHLLGAGEIASVVLLLLLLGPPLVCSVQKPSLRVLGAGVLAQTEPSCVMCKVTRSLALSQCHAATVTRCCACVMRCFTKWQAL